MKFKFIEEFIVKIFMIISILFVFGILISIIGIIFYKGISSLNLDIITKTSNGDFFQGERGGILNAIIGSFYIALGSTFLSFIVSLPIIIYLNLFLKENSNISKVMRFIFDVLSGIPSIVFGAFGLSILYFLHMKASLFGGIITVSILVLPIMCKGIDEVFRLLPKELIETSYALGSTTIEIALKIVFKQTLPGIITAVFLSFSRGISDAASVIFTSGYSDNIPTSLFDPAATLPLSIFFLLLNPSIEIQNKAYAASLILILIVFIFSFISRLIKNKLGKYIVK